MMTDPRLRIRPRLGRALGLSLDRLAPLLAGAVARRETGSQPEEQISSAERVAAMDALPGAQGTSIDRHGPVESGASVLKRAPHEGTATEIGKPGQAADLAAHLRLVDTAQATVPDMLSDETTHGTLFAELARPAPQTAPYPMRRRDSGAVMPEPGARVADRGDAHAGSRPLPERATTELRPLSVPHVLETALSRRRETMRAAGAAVPFAPVAAQITTLRPSAAATTETAAPTLLTHSQNTPIGPTPRATLAASPTSPHASALAALDRVFPRASEARKAPTPALAEREGPTLGMAKTSDTAPAPLDPDTLRAALMQLLEDDMRRHGLSPLGGV